MKKPLYLLLCLAAFVSCTGKSGSVGTTAGEKVTMQDGLPVIDLQKEYPKDSIALQDIADVEYIPLETNENALMEYVNSLFMDEHTIVTTTPKTGDILLFDRKGKHLNTFNHKGQGDVDYLSLYGAVAVDFPKKEIFVFDRRGKLVSIKVYSFEGTYLRTLPLPEYWDVKMYDYDEDYLLVEDCGQVDRPGKPIYVNLTPYRLLSKQTGEMKELPIQVTERVRERFFYPQVVDNRTVVLAMTFGMAPMAKSGDEVIIADFASDTIYTSRAGKVTPFALKANRISPNEAVIMTMPDGWSKRYLLLATQEKRLLKDVTLESASKQQQPQIPDGHLLLFDKEEREIKEVSFRDANVLSEKQRGASPNLVRYGLPFGYGITTYYPDRLLGQLEKGELKGELAELAKTLQEDDNPVLVLVKFKE